MTDEQTDEAPTFGEVVAENVRRLRVEAGISQTTLATMLSAMGPEWSKSNVAALERGVRQRLTEQELLQLGATLNVSVSELYAGDGVIAYGAGEIDRHVVREAFSSPDVPDLPITGPDLRAPFAVQSDLLAFEVADRLGVDLATVQQAAEHLFGRSVTQEQRQRLRRDPGDETRSPAVRRGNHTRGITNEIRRHLEAQK